MTMTSTATTATRVTLSCPAISTVTPSSMPTMPQPCQHIMLLMSHEADAISMPDLWMSHQHQGQPMHIDMNIQLDATHVNPSTSTSTTCLSTRIDNTTSTTCVNNTTSTTCIKWPHFNHRVDNPTSSTHVNTPTSAIHINHPYDGCHSCTTGLSVEYAVVAATYIL